MCLLRVVELYQLPDTLGCRTFPAFLAVSSLVTAVTKLQKIGDKERKREAQQILDKSLELACAIEDQLAMIGADEQLKSAQQQVNACSQTRGNTLTTSANAVAAQSRQVESIAARASIEASDGEGGAAQCLADLTNTKLWTVDGSGHSQLPSHRQLLKVRTLLSNLVLLFLPLQMMCAWVVSLPALCMMGYQKWRRAVIARPGVMQVSEEAATMRVKLAQIEGKRAEAQAQEQEQRRALEALESSVKRKTAQYNDVKFVQSLSLDD